MSACGVIKVIVGFYRLDSDAAFERHQRRILINNDLQTVESLKKHLVALVGLKELAIKYGLDNYELKLYRMLKRIGGKTENFPITTSGQWQLELPIMLAELVFDWICKVHW